MLYIHEKVAKLGGILLGGQVSSVEIQESAAIYVAQDDKGQVKKTQPVGYDNAKVLIDIILEDSREATSLEQLATMQQLFKAGGQQQAKLITIVNEDCAACGIFQVYFKSLSSKKVISESKRIVSLELWSPNIAQITVIKTPASKKSEEIEKAKTKGRNPGSKNQPQEGIGSIKKLDKSPAKDTRNTAPGKKAANKAVKHGRNTA